MDVGEGTGIELIEQLLVVDAASESNSMVSERSGLDALDIALRVGSAAHDDERPGLFACAERLNGIKDMILGLEASDDEVVRLRINAELTEPD